MVESDKYAEFLIKEYKSWGLYLHSNQNLIGRCYLWCKRVDALDFLEMIDEEREELFKAAKDVKQALVKLFKPDLFNYASLGNETNHLHLHIIPRYASERIFAGVTFNDPRWGHSHRTIDDFKISKDVFNQIKEQFMQALI